MPVRVPLLLVVCLLAGCASSSVFNPYPRQAESWKAAIASGNVEQSLEQLSRHDDSADRLLYLQEKARLAQLAGRYEESRTAFEQVIELYDQQDAAARLRLSDAGSGTASLLTNDNAIPYNGFDYERILAHGLQALNHLALDDPTAAAVELRRAALEQRVAAARREREIARIEEQAEEEDIDLARYDGYFQGLNAAAAEVKSAVQNAWTFYLSAAWWEGTGEYNDALVDYKKALEIHPDSAMLKEDVERVSAKLDGRRDDQGLVVVSYEQGFVPPRREVSVPIPTIHGYFAVAFPTYDPRDRVAPRPLRVQVGDQVTETEPLADIGGMAARALKEHLPAMIVRQTLRAAAKYGAQKRANEELGAVGFLFTQIYNLASERADLRSWLTLPAHAQATRLTLPAGEHTMELSTPGAGATVSVTVSPGAVTLLRVIDAGGGLRTETTPLEEER